MPMTPWKGQEASAIVFKDVGKRISAAARWFRDHLRYAVSVPNALFGPSGKALKGTRGLAPSAAGEYPRKVSGWLRKNIQSEYDAPSLSARVGTNVPYGRWLETGTSRMAPRPWLSNGLRDFIQGIRTILNGGGDVSGVNLDPTEGPMPERDARMLEAKIYKTEQALKELGGE